MNESWMRMDINKYLQRINLTEPITNDLASLRKLQETHLLHVPFENLDVIYKEPIYLNVPRIYDKIVTRHRGGFCYEVNGLFHWALTELGFRATLGSATVWRQDGYWAKEDTHMVIFVEIAGVTYLTDVGFGDANYQSILIHGKEQTDVSGTYQVVLKDNGWYQLTRKNEHGEWIPLYRFRKEAKEFRDFHEGIVFNQVSTGSSFTKHKLTTLATSTGRITLRDYDLTIRENGVVTKKEVNEAERINLLKDTFQLNLAELSNEE